MGKGYRYICFSLLLCISFPLYAQVVDTVLATPPVETASDRDTTSFRFLTAVSPVNIRTVPQQRVDSLKAEDDFWYANWVPEKKKVQKQTDTPERKSLFDAAWFRDLLWVIVLCSFIGVVLWYLAAGNILLFRKKAKGIATDEEPEVITDDIFSLPYDKEIRKAEDEQNYRLATRLHYLQLLKILSDKNLIEYRFERTNSAYLAQLRSSPFYRDFFRLTRNFEYTWYGEFALSTDVYAQLRTDFLNFKTRLRS